MKIPQQIDTVSISRAANAAHYEYMATIRRRIDEIPLESEIWKRATEEFRQAFEIEDKAFKQYRASDHTTAIRDADAERDRQYSALRDAIKAFAKFPIAETAQQAEPLMKVIRNYKIDTSENYMKESGNIENMLQDLLQYSTQLRKLGLDTLANQLKESNNTVRQLLASRNDERTARVMGELKTARTAADNAYAAVVFYTNAYAAMNPERREAADLVKRIAEDLDYFRRYAMAPAHRKKEDEPTPNPTNNDDVVSITDGHADAATDSNFDDITIK